MVSNKLFQSDVIEEEVHSMFTPDKETPTNLRKSLEEENEIVKMKSLEEVIKPMYVDGPIYMSPFKGVMYSEIRAPEVSPEFKVEEQKKTRN